MGPHPVVLFLVFNVKLPAGLLSFHKGPSGTYLGRQFGDIGPICCFTVESQRWRNLAFFPYWNSKPSCPKFFRSRVSPWFPVVMGYPASSSGHGPLFVLKHGDMVTPGGHPGTDPGKPSSSSCTVSWSRRSQTVFGEFSDANRGKSGYKWFLFWHSSWFLWKVIFFNYILTVFPVSEVPSVYSIPRPHPNSFRNDEYFWSRGGWKLQISWHRQW